MMSYIFTYASRSFKVTYLTVRGGNNKKITWHPDFLSIAECHFHLRVKFYLIFQECPSGVVNEDTFKDIYAQFFPQGGWWMLFGICRLIWSQGTQKLTLWALWCRNISSVSAFPTDASTYAHFLFNAFDTDHNGSVSFEVRRTLRRERH